MEQFSRYDLHYLFEERNDKIKHYIRTLSDEDVFSNQDEIIMNNMIEMYKFYPVKIEEELLENRDIKKTTIQRHNEFYDMGFPGDNEYFYIDGVEVISTFPFSGDKILFECKASTFSLGEYPKFELFDNYINISSSETLDFMNDENHKNVLFDRINHTLNEIKRYIGYCNNDVIKYNESIKDLVISELNQRKQKADKFYNIANMLEIPIKKSNPNIIENIKIERKIIPLVKKQTNSIQEYTISDEIYHDILSLIKHQGSTFERTPDVFTSLEEEQLRNLILSNLNSLFKGNANGECFRKHGKTDICIEYENRAAFVAECKIWSGINNFFKALDQLQGYLTWRDTKLSLIIFSRNKNFFNVLKEIKSHFSSIDNYVNYYEIDKNEFDLKIKSKNNEGQILKVRIFVFDLSF